MNDHSNTCSTDRPGRRTERPAHVSHRKWRACAKKKSMNQIQACMELARIKEEVARLHVYGPCKHCGGYHIGKGRG
jgi:hypothetical protein